VRPYIVKRTQIYLEDEQDRRLGERAKASARTKSDLIRDALDRYLDGDPSETSLRAFREAVVATAGAVSRFPPGDEYVRTIRTADHERDEQLEQRWRS